MVSQGGEKIDLKNGSCESGSDDNTYSDNPCYQRTRPHRLVSNGSRASFEASVADFPLHCTGPESAKKTRCARNGYAVDVFAALRIAPLYVATAFWPNALACEKIAPRL